MEIRQKLIQNGVANLKEFGYPDVNETNILTDLIYKEFFIGMLEENIAECDNPKISKELTVLLAELKPLQKRLTAL